MKHVKNRMITLLLIAIILISLSACGYGDAKAGPPFDTNLNDLGEVPAIKTISPKSTTPALEQPNTTANETMSSGISLKELYELYTFTYDGEQYTLPFSVQDILDTGLVLSYNDPNDILDPMTYANHIQIGEPGGTEWIYKPISVDIYNPSSISQKCINCKIARIYLSGPSLGEDLKLRPFATSRGIRIGSSKSEVKEAYGEPTNEYSSVYEYKFIVSDEIKIEMLDRNNNGSDKIRFEFDDSGNVDGIEMEFIFFD